MQELPKAKPAVVLVFKGLRRRGNGLKSHPTDWEKPGTEPATPGLQDIGLSPTPRRLLFMIKTPIIRRKTLSLAKIHMKFKNISLQIKDNVANLNERL